MKHNIMGKKILRTYQAHAVYDDEMNLLEKPKLKYDDRIDWVVIGSYNSFEIKPNGDCHYHVSISENEEIAIVKRVFRVDEKAVYLYSTKEVEIVESGKEDALELLKELTIKYDRQKALSNAVECDENGVPISKFANCVSISFDPTQMVSYTFNGSF